MIEPDQTLLTRNTISSASTEGIVVTVNDVEEFRPWSSVTAASAGIVKHGQADIFVMAVAFDDVRTFVLGEVEAAWPQMIEFLHIGLPGVEPFSSWGPKLLAKPGVLELFEREE